MSGWLDAELALTALAAMLSPTTLSFSVLALVVGDRPFRTGSLFYLGALTATLAVGVAAAFVLGDSAAVALSSTPKTWVAVFDVVAGVLLLVWVVVVLRRPPNAAKTKSMTAQMTKVAASPSVAVIGAGAVLANPGAFIPIALKEISERNPSAPEYVVEWVFFSVVSLLPLLLARHARRRPRPHDDTSATCPRLAVRAREDSGGSDRGAPRGGADPGRHLRPRRLSALSARGVQRPASRGRAS